MIWPYEEIELDQQTENWTGRNETFIGKTIEISTTVGSRKTTGWYPWGTQDPESTKATGSIATLVELTRLTKTVDGRDMYM